ncbi:RHS repeat-associated core domain-containing protein [Actinoplanes sp. NPDC051346]|uniref:RHS repeat-associated core domain-containing protein n=1 Tax=Actinoplanes sp. NPDC051346 TaxID=3155048 RepID=UPI00342E3D18
MSSGWRSRLFISFGYGWRRRAITLLAAFTAVTLGLSLVQGMERPEPASAAPAAPAKPACPDDRPDPASATVTAKLCGKRVEVLSQRSEKAQVWALPEGGFTSEVFAGPVRFRQGDAWRPVDLTLRAAADGSVAPVGHPYGLRLSGEAGGAGEHTLAGVTVGGDSLSMVWTGRLPSPALSDNVATYAEVRPGVDLVVEATRTGFEQSLVVKNRAAAARVSTLTLPLRSKGLRFVADGPASLAIRDAGGKVLGRIPTPTMWDAQVGPAGEKVREKAMSVRSRPRGSRAAVALAKGIDVAGGTGAVDLVVTPERAWLNDPATVYPVRLDPQIDLDPGSDTLVRSDQLSTSGTVDHSGANYLAYGKGTSYLARSFLQWPTAQFAGGRITSATLHLWNWYSGSCSQTGWLVWNTAPYNNPIYWDTQPALLSNDGYSTQTAGYSTACNDAWVSASVQPFFQRAADARAPTAYMGLSSYNETNPSLSWKQARSLQAADQSQVPYVRVTYDAAPFVSAPQAAPSNGGCVTGDGRPFVTSKTPQLRTTTSDADTSAVSVTFEWWVTGGSKVGEATVGAVPSGTVASTTVPAGVLQEAGTYSWRVKATDGSYSSDWSPWCEFTVDTVRPAVPLASSTAYPSITTDNSWGHGAYNQAGDFVLTPAAGSGDLAAFVYQLDNQTSPTTVTTTAATTVSITPGEDGQRTLRVWAKDKAGNQSDPHVYTFNVGRAGLTQPRPGANVVKRTKLSIDGDATYTRVRYQYRRGPGATEYDVPTANLRKADNSAVAAYPLRLSELGGYSVWNAVDTLGLTGGVAQVRALLFPDADGTAGYATQWITINVDPNGDGAAASDAGPGSVNLLTGDFQLSSTDVDEFGMTVGRGASSREPTDGWVPQGERLTPAQQQVTDLNGFGTGGTSTLSRSTTRGQGPSTDSLEITPTLANGDTYAALGAEYTLSLGMKPGRRYRATAWIYVPGSSGLSTIDGRGLRIVGYAQVNGAYQSVMSAKAAYVDAWQELTVDLTVPTGANQAFFRLYDGHAGGSGKLVQWDNLSVREVVAPFGPQWRGGAADGLGSSGYETLSFPSPDVAKITVVGGDHLTFGRSQSGQFFPEPGSEDLSLVKVNDTTYRLAELDGGYTEFTAQGGVFVASSTRTDEESSTARYLYDVTDNRTLLKKIINPVEPGVGDCTAVTPAAGCELLEYEYATATTATATGLGDYTDRVARVKFWAWNPTAAAVDATVVASYAYDDQGRLREVWDPRLGSGATPLKTRYEYDASGRVTRVTPTGELPWMFDYGAAGSDPDTGRLLRVRRAALAAGTKDQTDGEIATNVVYNVPLTRAEGGPYDLDAAAVARWAQSDVPTDATALFGPEGPPGTNTATESTPGRDGYVLSTAHYLNANGEEINTATPGGFIDSQQFDQFGNEVWSLEASNRALALGALPDAAAKAAELGLPAGSAQRAQLLATVSRFSPDGLDLVETLAPVTRVVLDEPLAAAGKPTLPAGSEVVARGRTVKTYDEGKPDGAAYHLVTTETSGARVDGYPTDADLRVNRYGYGNQRGGTSGWVLKKATSTTGDAGPGGTPITTYAVFDAAGKVLRSYGVEANAAGTDPRTTITVYYTAGANADDAACGDKPQWAGQPCVTKAGGPATGHDPARMTADLPVKRVLEYSRSGDASVIAETSAGKTRTTRTTYDAADRVIRVEITSDDGSMAVPATETEYDTVTGHAVLTRSGSATIHREFDSLGRLLSYRDADGGVTRTEFDRYGKPLKVADNTGITTYAYDRAAEPRGFLTSVTDSVAGTFGARYSPDGQLIEVRYPGGLTRTDTLDATFTPTARTYSRDTDGAPVYAETTRHNSHGELVSHNYTGGSKAYGYDRKGRLTSVQQIAGGPCTTRIYTYDGRTNRTAKRTYGSDAGGTCRADGTADAEEGHTYDSADRITDAGYVYDAYGRTTALPNGLTNKFYANDLVATQQFGDARQSWTLDPVQRLRGWTTEKLVNGSWSQASSKLNHFGDDSDEPRWIVEDASLGTITRNVSGPDADLVATTSATGDVRLQLANLQGSIVATVNTGLTAPELYTYDEFGAPAAGQTGLRYGWLGAKQRSGDALNGVILMGVRLYSPALGRFLTVDPEVGGNDNAYEYCSGDPVNCTDLDGKWGFKLPSFKKVMNAVGAVASYASMIPGPIGVAAGLVSAGAYAAAGNWKQAAWALAGAGAAIVGAGAAVRAARIAVTAVRASSKAGRAGASAARAGRASKLASGNSAAARSGKSAHKAFGDYAAARGWKGSTYLGKNSRGKKMFADAVRGRGRLVELKHGTSKSSMRKGRTQLRGYMHAQRKCSGELWGWYHNGSGGYRFKQHEIVRSRKSYCK